MPAAQAVSPSDLFVVLDQAFRRRSRGCKACDFSLPYRLPNSESWAVDPSRSCSYFCRLVLEDLVDEFRPYYRLTAPAGFRTH
jgi:hypothetical protein